VSENYGPLTFKMKELPVSDGDIGIIKEEMEEDSQSDNEEQKILDID